MTRGFLRFVRGNAIAMLALFIALGGTTYAATTLGKNTVGSPQVINGSLQTKDLSGKARKALKGNRGPQGVAGAAGPKGATGAQGVQGLPGPSTGPAGGALSGSYPNPTIATSTRGVALAGVETPGGVSPAVGVWFNRLGGVPTITRTGAGQYTVTFPGIAANVTTNVIASGNGPNDDQVSISSGGGSLFVSVLNGAGTAVDDYFSLVIYGASTSG